MFCKIREWRTSDAADLATALSNKKVQDNLRDGLPFPYKESDGLDFINAMLSSDKNNTFSFAITVDDKVIGSIGVFRQDNIHRLTAELGYYIAEEYWGKGIMTEAVKQIVNLFSRIATSFVSTLNLLLITRLPVVCLKKQDFALRGY